MRNLRTMLVGGMLAMAILAWTGASAVVLLDSGGASGAWYSPSRSGEGFFVEIAESGNQNRFVVTWYTYDGNRNQMWIGGNVLIPAGATSITVPVTVTSGPIFGDAFDASDVEYTPWGNLTFRFSNCDSGVVSYDSSIGFGSGTINLVRLTNPKQVTCDDALAETNQEPPLPESEPPQVEVVDKSSGIDLRVRPTSESDIVEVRWTVAQSVLSAGANDFELQLYVGGGVRWHPLFTTDESTEAGAPIFLGDAPEEYCFRMVATMDANSPIIGSGTSGNKAPCL